MATEELKLLQNEIKQIKTRNQKVEADKAWETSFTRKALIAVLTYILIASFFYVSGNDKPFVSALVPTFGYLLSTLTLNYFKSLWIRRYEGND